ncbi:MAG: PTS lactose/cellobiose transporter subunit IIA [Treponema sp.]|jgi:PTS system cellobiose-specific IIA component|nr:PTS lactose/cellobiose transporter subunit IIA [Treponema sp.]
MNDEQVAMDLIIHAGNAKSLAMEAIGAAKKSEFDEAKEKLRLAGESLQTAHVLQTEILEYSLGSSGVSMLMVHAQDQLMDAMTILAMAGEFMDLYKLVYTNIPAARRDA